MELGLVRHSREIKLSRILRDHRQPRTGHTRLIPVNRNPKFLRPLQRQSIMDNNNSRKILMHLKGSNLHNNSPMDSNNSRNSKILMRHKINSLSRLALRPTVSRAITTAHRLLTLLRVRRVSMNKLKNLPAIRCVGLSLAVLV